MNDDGFCIALATYKHSFNATMYEIQQSSVTEENKENISDVVLAMKYIHEVFQDIILKGEAQIAIRDKKKIKPE